MRAAATYFLARSGSGAPLDPVARFHLGNGARLEQLDWLADLSEQGLAQSHGLMVNYLYDLDDIEKNHEALCGEPHRRRVERDSQAGKGAAGAGEGVSQACEPHPEEFTSAIRASVSIGRTRLDGSRGGTRCCGILRDCPRCATQPSG